MLYFALTVSVLHLAWMNWLAYRKSSLSICWATSLLPFFLCGFMGIGGMPILFQAIALPLVLTLCRHAPKRPALFPMASILAVAAIFGILFLRTWSVERDLLHRYPMESMAERVPAPRPSERPVEFAQEKAWKDFENELEAITQWNGRNFFGRGWQLQRLHEESTNNFIDSSGFGVTRMSSMNALQPKGYDQYIQPVAPVKQPETAGPVALSSDVLEKPYVPNNLGALSQLHFDGLGDFVNISGFGYVKDRQHVAGFRPHEFSNMPGGTSLRVQRLELVSLLMHEQPVVYVSNELPRIKELKASPTRTLSDFEKTGLGALQKGEDLFVREVPERLLMLGAIRSVSQCVKCHGGERGDLLGAFSYILEPDSDK